MDHNTWTKLDGYTRSGALSGADAAAYAGTLSAYDTLTGLSREFGEALERARGERKAKEARS